jgi:hypothetical protein
LKYHPTFSSGGQQPGDGQDAPDRTDQSQNAAVAGSHIAGSAGPGTDVMIFKIFSPPKKFRKIGVFDSKQS